MVKLLKTLIQLLGIVILILSIYLLYVFSDYNKYINKVTVKEIVKNIKASKAHNEELILIYDKINNNILDDSLWDELNDLLEGKRNNCPCLNIVASRYYQNRYKIAENDYVISNMLEKSVSKRECVNYIMNEFYYLYNAKGIEEASQLFYQKSLEELKKDELVGLLIMQENPTLYNPRKYNKIYENKIKEVMQRIEI